MHQFEANLTEAGIRKLGWSGPRGGLGQQRLQIKFHEDTQAHAEAFFRRYIRNFYSVFFTAEDYTIRPVPSGGGQIKPLGFQDPTTDARPVVSANPGKAGS